MNASGEALAGVASSGALNIVTSDILKPLWQKIMARLRVELGDDLFNSWFGRVDMESCAEGQLVVSVPTRFLKSWIESHYIGKLQKIAETEFGALKHIHVKVRQQGTAAAQTHRVQPTLQKSTPTDSLRPRVAATPSLVMGLR